MLIKEQLIAEKMNGGLRKKPSAAKEFDSTSWTFFMHFKAYFS